MKKHLSIALILCLLVFSLTACVKTPTDTSKTEVPASATPVPTESTLTVTDFLERTVTLAQTATKIVSLTPSNTELIYALGLQDKLVGVDASSNYPEAAAALTKVGDYSGPNLETILSLEPDLVLAGNKLQAETVQQLEDKGLTVIASEANRYEEIYTSIDMIAKLCGATEKAAAVKSEMRATEQEITTLVTGKTAPRVYYVLSFGEYGDYTIGSDNFITDLLTIAGADVVTKNHEVSWPKYSVEQMIADNPDAVLYDSYLNVDDLKKATGYSELTAIKAGKLYVVNSDKISRPANRCIDEALEIAKKLYS